MHFKNVNSFNRLFVNQEDLREEKLRHNDNYRQAWSGTLGIGPLRH